MRPTPVAGQTVVVHPRVGGPIDVAQRTNVTAGELLAIASSYAAIPKTRWNDEFRCNKGSDAKDMYVEES